MQVQGTIFFIGETQLVSESFQKREVILTIAENPTYPEYVKFEVTQDKCDLLDSFEVGQEVEVDFNLRGRAWTNKAGETSYFNTLAIWKISAVK